MDAQTYNLTLRDIRAKLATLLEQAVQKRNEQRAKLIAVHQSAGDYSQEYLQKQLATIEASIAASNADLHERARSILEDWSQTMQARFEQPLDLTDPVISSAINLITVAGHQLPHEDLTRLVDGFRGNPAALRALRAVFEAQDLSRGVEMVRTRTYEPAIAMIAITGAADAAFRSNGSLNNLAYEASRVFAYEGLEFDRVVDDAGFTETMRAGAGLPPIPGVSS